MQMKHLLIAAVALLTAACLPVTSKVAIGTTKGLGVDAGLVGTWKMKFQDSDDKGTYWAHFVPAKDGTLTILLAGAGIKDGKPDGFWMNMKGRTARLAESRYLNVTMVSSDGEPDKSRGAKDSIPLLYRYNNARSVTLYMIDEKKAADAITAKKIAGIVEKGSFSNDVIFTAPAAEQDKFFQSKEGLALFAKPYAILTKTD